MRRLGVLAAVLAAALACAPVAGAAVGSTGPTGPSKVVNPGDPGSSQYQEDVPSAFGGVPAANVWAHARHARIRATPSVVLPHAVASTLANDGRAGRAAAALAVAGTPTQATRTAPARHRRAPTARRGRHRRSSRAPARVSRPATRAGLIAGQGRSVPASLSRALFGSDGGLGRLLPILLAMSALFAAGVAVGRRRGRRGRSG